MDVCIQEKSDDEIIEFIKQKSNKELFSTFRTFELSITVVGRAKSSKNDVKYLEFMADEILSRMNGNVRTDRHDP